MTIEAKRGSVKAFILFQIYAYLEERMYNKTLQVKNVSVFTDHATHTFTFEF